MPNPDFLRRVRIISKAWQYWPWPVVYFPLFLQYFYHSCRFMGVGFPAIINRPFMNFGGIFEESKWGIHQKIPAMWNPKTQIFPRFNEASALQDFLDYHQFKFPLILKPDRGMRGKGIQLHHNIHSLFEHNLQIPKNQTYLIQAYLNLPHEIGVFMVKNGDSWQVSSLMKRELPQVVGDGKHSVEELIRFDNHLFMQLPKFSQDPSINLEHILPPGEVLVLSRVGNHRLGTRFINRNIDITPEFEMAMQRLCDLLKGFEYGRLDIRYLHWEELLQLKHFSIIEVNGASSEPAHIYDEQTSLKEAWQTLLTHHHIIFKMAQNARKNGQTAPSFAKSARLFMGYLQTMRLQ